MEDPIFEERPPGQWARSRLADVLEGGRRPADLQLSSSDSLDQLLADELWRVGPGD